MIRALLLSFFLLTSSFSAIKHQLEGVYNIEYGIFGKLGTADASIEVKSDNSYEIKAKAYATGLAKVLSGNMVEEYLSTGNFIDGYYKPHYFKKTTSKNGYTKIEEYFFDRKKRKILKKEYKKEKKRKFDSSDLTNIEYEYIEKRKKEVLSFWSEEDILSLFFNVKKYIDTKQKGRIEVVSAVGASNKRDGKIDILVPDEEKHNKLSEEFNKEDDILIVKIYKKIFASKEGEFFLSVNEEGLCSKTVLKDVIFFGDITATLEKKKSLK
eukprot:Anaeramoba_flamelloidesc38465_g1_i2.p3 GENE.c38465_g1_i2~~c38465_g1_i2.p3  ORF type:complete len:268 (+),score=27.13 c38465_g1_i2:2104-2907(+)